MKRIVSAFLVVLMLTGSTATVLAFDEIPFLSEGTADATSGEKTEDELALEQLPIEGVDGPEEVDYEGNNLTRAGSSKAETLISIAASQLGNNGQKYWDWWGAKVNWCAVFVAWCAEQSGIPTSKIPRMGLVANMQKFYADKNLIVQEPQRGDLFFLYTTRYSHVGIVTGVDDKYIYTLEGNTSYKDNGIYLVREFKRLKTEPANYARVDYGDTTTKTAEFVTRMYKLALGREPDAGGLQNWVNNLNAGKVTGADVAGEFLLGKEVANKNLSNDAFVDLAYSTILDRKADANGKADWVAALEQGVGRPGIIRGFVGSQEFNRMCFNYGIKAGSFKVSEPRDQNTNLTRFVYRLYVQTLGRGADINGLNDWTGQLLAGKKTPEQVAYGFIFSSEFTAKNLSNADYVTILYKAFFNRAPDNNGFADWKGKLDKNTHSRLQVFNGFVYSNEFKGVQVQFGV